MEVNGRKVGEIKLTYELDFNKKLLTAKIEADEELQIIE